MDKRVTVAPFIYEEHVQKVSKKNGPISLGDKIGLISAVIVTIGDFLATIAVAMAIEDSVIEDQENEQEKKDQEQQLSKMQSQIEELQKEIRKLQNEKQNNNR